MKKNYGVKERRRVKKLLKKILIVFATIGILSASAYHLCSGYMDGIKSILPNVAYTHSVHIRYTKVPYFISFVPIEKLYITDAPNLNMIIAPFGIEEIRYTQSDAIESVNIPENAISVELNCANLNELELPDGVVEVTLNNASDKLLTNMKIPDSLKKMALSGSGAIIDSLTSKGIEELKDEDSIEYLKIENSYLIEDLVINLPLKGLSISEFENLKSVVLNETVETFWCKGSLENFTVNGKTGIVAIENVDKLLGTGSISEYYGIAINEMTLCSVPRVLSMEYKGEEKLIIPDGVEVLDLRIDDFNKVTLPENIRAAKIWHYEGQEGVGDSNLYGTYFNFLSGHKYDMEELTWRNLDEIIMHYTETTRGSY